MPGFCPVQGIGTRSGSTPASASLFRVERLSAPVTIGKTLVEQERKPGQYLINTPRLGRILHRVTDETHPETRQSIVIPIGSALRNRKPLNLASHNRLGFIPPIVREHEPCETKMAPTTKLLSWKITIVEEA
jgi:hypothetical protein